MAWGVTHVEVRIGGLFIEKRAPNAQHAHAKGVPQLCDSAPDTAHTNHAQRLARQFAPTQIIPAGAPGPDMAILQTYHLRPVPVKHQHAAKNILANRSRVNPCSGGHDYPALYVQKPAIAQAINARSWILQPAQMGR